MGSVTLVVGRRSLIASALRQHGTDCDCRYVGHDELGNPDLLRPDLLQDVNRIVNFALHPDYRQSPYRPDIDLDRRLGQWAADRGLAYVMMSSRKVYSPESAFGVDEDGPLGPVDHYGRNKLTTERFLADLLGSDLTILRIGNVLAYERIPGRRSFMNAMLGSLVDDDRIMLDVSPFVRRDFLPLEELAALLAEILNRDLRGVFNVGSGTAIEVGRIALWLIEGFGRGCLSITSPRHHDEFRLEVGRLSAALGAHRHGRDLADYCRGLGRRLAAEVRNAGREDGMYSLRMYVKENNLWLL